MADQDKVHMAVVAMEGDALNWGRWVLRPNPNVTWSHFTGELLKRFNENLLYELFETFMNTTQQDSEDAYIDGFVARIEHVTD